MQTLTDGSILRGLGVVLARENGVARPAQKPEARSQKLEWVCAWCQRERGELGQPHQTHGICERHRAEMMAQIQRRAA